MGSSMGRTFGNKMRSMGLQAGATAGTGGAGVSDGNSNNSILNALATANQSGLAGAGSGATNSAINNAFYHQGVENPFYQANQAALNRQGPAYQPGGMFYHDDAAGAGAAPAGAGPMAKPAIAPAPLPVTPPAAGVSPVPPTGIASGLGPSGGGGGIMPPPADPSVAAPSTPFGAGPTDGSATMGGIFGGPTAQVSGGAGASMGTVGAPAPIGATMGGGQAYAGGSNTFNERGGYTPAPPVNPGTGGGTASAMPITGGQTGYGLGTNRIAQAMMGLRTAR